MADKVGGKKKPLGVTTQTMKAESKENECGRRKQDGLMADKVGGKKKPLGAPNSMGTEATVPGALLDLILCTTSSNAHL